jgi:uncharacterized protein YkwD
MQRGTPGLGTTWWRATLALVSLCLLALPAQAHAASVTQRDAAESALVARINDVRASHGLRRLEVSNRLQSAATRHANSMGSVGYFRHELYTPTRSVTWTPWGTWIRWYYPGPGFSSWSAGENLAWGAPDLSPRAAVNRWLGSSGHRANLLAPEWRQVGVSIVHVSDPLRYYASWNDATIVVAEFGRRS